MLEVYGFGVPFAEPKEIPQAPIKYHKKFIENTGDTIIDS